MGLGPHLGIPGRRSKTVLTGFARPWFAMGVTVGNLPAARTEISDLASPRNVVNSNHIWAVTDGPDNALLSINLMGGGSSGVITITGMTPSPVNDDLESMGSSTFGGFPWLILGFSGDNGSAKASFRVATLLEPTVTGSDQAAYGGLISDFTCEYPAGNLPAHKDCETLLVDPDTGDVYFICKRVSPIPVYRLINSGTPSSWTGLQTLAFMGFMTNDATVNTISTMPGGASNGYIVGGTINPQDKREILLKSYDRVMRWYRGANESIIATLQRPPNQILTDAYVGGGSTPPKGIHANGEPQGEAICFHYDGVHFYTASEFDATQGSSASRYPLFVYQRLPKAPTTKSFQSGALGVQFADTFIDSSAPATPQGSAASLVADFDYSAYPTTSRVRQILLWWDFTGHIPTNAIVTGAKIDVYVNTEGLGLEVYRMISNWGVGTVANDFGGRILHNDVHASSTLMGRIVTPAAGGLDNVVGFFRINLLISEVQGWVTTPASNIGIMLQAPEEDTTGDGVQIDSMEGAVQAQKPKLTISYYVP